jgi:phosphate/sulfate permease
MREMVGLMGLALAVAALTYFSLRALKAPQWVMSGGGIAVSYGVATFGAGILRRLGRG